MPPKPTLRPTTPSRTPKAILPAVAALSILIAVACQTNTPDTNQAATATTPTTSTTTQPPPTSDLTELVEELVVVDSPPQTPPYERELFAHWSDLDANGCDTRDDVLAAQSENSVDCHNLDGGTWTSRYDGVRTTKPEQLQIDHVVSLSDAWRSGAWSWEPTQRETFANSTQNLVAVSASSNQAKSDKTADLWQPARSEAQCWYAGTVVRVKHTWELSVDPWEKDALAEVLSGCPDDSGSSDSPKPELSVPATSPVGPAAPGSSLGCDPNYEPCLPVYPPDLNCGDVGHPVRVVGPNDPHGLDGDGDGAGCEG